MFKLTDTLRFTGQSIKGLHNGQLCKAIGHIMMPRDIVYRIETELGKQFEICDAFLELFIEEPAPEMVRQPNHYNMGKHEVIDVIEDWKLCYNLGNAVKYIGRSAHKGKEIEDLEKAVYSIQRQIDLLTHG